MDETPPIADAQLNVYNFARFEERLPSRYGALRFDPNNTCNLHCVYCHNHRSEETIDLARFRAVLRDKVLSVAWFQVGCIMEPTLDRRLTDFMLGIAASPARPSDALILQTNGTLLHMHDYGAMREAGLSKLSVSLDTADPQTQRDLRGGLSLRRVVTNVEAFAAACPKVMLEFVCTVTTSNVDHAPELVRLGLGLGVSSFIFREMFYYPENNVVDHARMPGLQLKGDRFLQLRDSIMDQFDGQAAFTFATAAGLDVSARTMIANSGFVGRDLPARAL